MRPTTVEAAREAADDAALARAAADAAGRALMKLRASGSTGRLGARGDARAQRTLIDVLRTARPDDSVLSEEAPDDAARLSARRVWIIDPLDGTREFGEQDRADWAVHVALWVREGPNARGVGVCGRLVAAAVALPGRGTTLATDDPPALPPVGARRLRIAVSRTRPPAFVADLADALNARLVPLGSAGYKVSAVVLGEVDAYLHAGGQYEWDSAAPVAVACSSGLHASRLDGSRLVYNSPDPLLPDLLVCRPELATMLLRSTAAVMTNGRSDR